MKRNSIFSRVSPVERSLQPNNLLDRVDALESSGKRRQVRNVVVNYITDLVNNATYPTVEQTVTIINNQVIAVNTEANWKNLFVFDEFTSLCEFNTATNSAVGELGWEASSNAGVQLNGISSFSGFNSHYGIVSVWNTATLEGYIRLNNLYLATAKLVQFVCTVPATVNAGDGYVFGLSDNSGGGGFAVDGSMKGAYFKREDGEANWHVITRDGVGITDTDTGVLVVADAWVLLEIKQPIVGTIEFYINQNLVATHTTNVDTANAFDVVPTVGVIATTTLYLYLDYFAMQLVEISQRWD